MLHAHDESVRAHLLEGGFGLEKESLRIDGGGFLAHTPADFADDVHIVRDFSENQVEVNTPVCATPAEAIQSLEHYNGLVQRAIANLPERELLWPFSNPPYILNEKDIPIAQYFGDDAGKTEYREYLSDRYGRYKMAFSGIHLNYSFGEALLRADYELARAESPDAPAIFEAYRDQFYVRLAENCVAYSWILTAVMAAEPGVRLLLRGEGPASAATSSRAWPPYAVRSSVTGTSSRPFSIIRVRRPTPIPSSPTSTAA